MQQSPGFIMLRLETFSQVQLFHVHDKNFIKR